MPSGVLKKGFVINTPSGLAVRIRRGTKITFHGSSPTIEFEDLPEVRLIKIDREWYVDIYGGLFLMEFEQSRPPYPLSYFK